MQDSFLLGFNGCGHFKTTELLISLRRAFYNDKGKHSDFKLKYRSYFLTIWYSLELNELYKKKFKVDLMGNLLSTQSP